MDTTTNPPELNEQFLETAKNGHTAAVLDLIKPGADVNTTSSNFEHKTALMLAAQTWQSHS